MPRKQNAGTLLFMSTDAPLQFKVDPGADVSVVPSSFAGCPVDLDKPNNERLMGPGRCRLRLLGTFPATLSWRGRSVCKTLYVVADIDSPLLGYLAVVDLRVVQFVDTVENAEAPNRPPNVRQSRSFAVFRPWRDA
ncbi:hypothetical protein MRX96_055016 [Rhipicephalus microplus]